MATNMNSGADYSAKENSNIAKVAGHVTAAGSLIVTDSTAASAANSYCVITLTSGALQFKYYNTASSTLSSGTFYTTISAAAL